MSVPWFKRAGCLGMDSELFMTDMDAKKENIALAKTICFEQCTVREDCLASQMDLESHLEVFERDKAIYGGLTQRQRARLQIRRDVAKQPRKEPLKLHTKQLDLFLTEEVMI